MKFSLSKARVCRLSAKTGAIRTKNDDFSWCSNFANLWAHLNKYFCIYLEMLFTFLLYLQVIFILILTQAFIEIFKNDLKWA